MQLFERGAVQRRKLLEVDDEHVGYGVAALIADIDGERDRREQAGFVKRGIGGGRGSHPLVQQPQHAGDVIEIGGVAAMLEEQRQAGRVTDARIVEIDLQHRLADIVLCGPGHADGEGTAPVAGGNVAARPAVVGEKEILVAVEPQQRIGLKTLVAAAEHDCEFALQFLEFGGEDQRLIGRVIECGARARADAQVGMIDIIDLYGVHPLRSLFVRVYQPGGDGQQEKAAARCCGPSNVRCGGRRAPRRTPACAQKR